MGLPGLTMMSSFSPARLCVCVSSAGLAARRRAAQKRCYLLRGTLLGESAVVNRGQSLGMRVRSGVVEIATDNLVDSLVEGICRSTAQVSASGSGWALCLHGKLNARSMCREE